MKEEGGAMERTTDPAKMQCPEGVAWVQVTEYEWSRSDDKYHVFKIAGVVSNPYMVYAGAKFIGKLGTLSSAKWQARRWELLSEGSGEPEFVGLPCGLCGEQENVRRLSKKDAESARVYWACLSCIPKEMEGAV